VNQADAESALTVSQTAGSAQDFEATGSPQSASTRSPLRLIIDIGLLATAAALLLTITAFLLGFRTLGVFSFLLVVSIVALAIKGVIEISTAKARAIRRGEREVDLFFNWVKLVLWEQNEGLVLLKDKRINEVIYGPETGGGMRFLFPFQGEEIKIHVPLTLQLSEFYDRKVLTRESIQLSVKLALWWRVKGREGLEKFYLLIGKEVHHVSDTEEQVEADYGVPRTVGVRKSPRRAELNAAQKWLVTLAESYLRKLVSKTSVAMIVSSRATRYLHVGSQHEGQATTPASPPLPPLSDGQVVTPADEGDATPDALADQLQAMLAPEAEQYGLEINRIEVQEAQLPTEIQAAIDRVWKATLLPAQTSQEARARYHQIKAELEAVKEVIGGDAAAVDHILKNVRGMKFYGGLSEPIEELLAGLFRKVQQDSRKLLKGQTPATLPTGSDPVAESPT
jgi:regulator of protease activity HflC (stomatin/prohibitin superfamily)